MWKRSLFELISQGQVADVQNQGKLQVAVVVDVLKGQMPILSHSRNASPLPQEYRVRGFPLACCVFKALATPNFDERQELRSFALQMFGSGDTSGPKIVFPSVGQKVILGARKAPWIISLTRRPIS